MVPLTALRRQLKEDRSHEQAERSYEQTERSHRLAVENALRLADQWKEPVIFHDKSLESTWTVVKSESRGFNISLGLSSHPSSYSSSSSLPFQSAPVKPISSRDQTIPALIQKPLHPLCSAGILKCSVSPPHLRPVSRRRPFSHLLTLSF